MTSFVTLDSSTGNLMLNGKRFRFGGANAPSTGASPTPPYYPDHAELDGLLAEAVSMKHTVLRLYGAIMSAGLPQSVQPTIGVLNPAALESLDYVLMRCATLGIKVIIPFCEGSQNFYGDGTGYKSWYCSQCGITPDSVASQFFTSPTVVAGFKNFISLILNHANRYTDVKYKDDPTILAWETGNELSQYPANNPDWPDYCAVWTESIAQHVKITNAAKQLMVDGHCGVTANGAADTRVLTSPHVDIFQGHAYGKFSSIGDQVQGGHVAKAFGKAYIIGEYGWNGQSPAWPYSYEGPSYASVCPGVEASKYIDGDMYWELLAPGKNWGAALNFTLHAPGDNPAMVAAAQRLAEHSAFMSSGRIGNATGPEFLIDSFTDADGVLLENHVGERGATWVKSGQTGTMTVGSDGVYASSGDALYRASAIPPSPDYQVVGTVRIASVSGDAWIAGRVSGSTGYMALLYRYTPPWWMFWASPAWVLTLRQYVNGVATDLGSAYPSATVGQEYDLGLVMKGDQISVTWDGTVTVLGPITNSSITATGSAGVGGNFMSPTTGYHIRAIAASPV